MTMARNNFRNAAALRVLGKSAPLGLDAMPRMESLRLLGSTGEPWDEASWMWFFERVGRRDHDRRL